MKIRQFQTILFLLLTGNLICAQTFTKILTGPVVTSPGDSRSVNWVDINNDGLTDLFISNGKAGGQNNMLYINADGGMFTEVIADPMVLDNKPSDGSTFADADNDGDMDGFVVNWYNEDNLFYTNDGFGSFTQIVGQPVVTSGGYSETAAWGDYDNDGLVDLYVTRSGSTSAQRRNLLYHNDGGNSFTKILLGEAVTNTFLSRSANWTDIDSDGDLDLFVTNEGASANNENIYRNDSGTLVRIISGELVTNGGSTMSSSWADYDNDGDLDVYLTNDGSDNALFRNDGNFNFTKIIGDPVTTTNAHSFSSAWSDIDNDGDLDLFVTNAFTTAAQQLNFLFTNDGDGTFTKVLTGPPATDLSWSYGCAFGDYDNDGFEDLAVATTTYNGVDEFDMLYHNDGNANKWLTVKLVGITTNKSAIGTKIRVRAVINGVSVWQMREISSQTSYCGQNDIRAHFGLGDAAIVDEIKIEWLSGDVQTFKNVNANQFLTIAQGQLAADGFQKKTDSIKIYPNPVSDILHLESNTNMTILDVSIYNAVGQLLLTSTETDIDVSELAAGNYFLNIHSTDGSSHLRFLKK